MLKEEVDGDESRLYQLHKQWGTLETDFYPRKPKQLNHRQRGILNAFYSARREIHHESHIPKMLLTSFANSIQDYETDLAVMVMQSIDNEYMRLCCDKISRDAERMRSKHNGNR